MDDTTSHSGKYTKTVITNLKEDVTGELKVMAFNGLVALSSKTEFMLIKSRKDELSTLAQLKV